MQISESQYLNESVYESPDSSSWSDTESSSEIEPVKKSSFEDRLSLSDRAHSFVPNYILQKCLIDLKMFNKLEPNTWVQLNSENHFEPLGGTYSCFAGIQFGYSYFKGYTPEIFLIDFKKFVGNITEALAEVAEEGSNSYNEVIKQKRFNEIQSVGHALKQALIGDMKDGGLYGLLLTHQKDHIYADLKEVMRHLKETVERKVDSSRYWGTNDFTKSQIFGNSSKLPYWPEKKYKDDDWANAMVRSANLPIESATIGKHIQYWTSTVKNTDGTGNLWNQIPLTGKGQIILGPKPMIKQFAGQEIRNDLTVLKKLNVHAVLSATEVYKMQATGLVTVPVTLEQWRKEGVKHLYVPISDSPSIPVEDILTGVEFIRWCLGKGETILVHCEDDMNRSTLIVICYLVLYRNYTADKALEYVKAQCPKAPIQYNFTKLTLLYEFEEKYKLSWNC